MLAATLVLVGSLHIGAPFLALLFSYFVLTKLGRFIRSKWLALALFILILLGIGYTAGHFIRAAVSALPKIADNSIPAASAWAEAREIHLPFTDFESLKTMARDALKEEAHYLGNVANFARSASTLLVFGIIGIVAAISLFFNSQLDQTKTKVRNSAALSRARSLLFEDQNVAASGSLRPDETSVSIDRLHAEDRLVKTEGPFRISHREGNVSQAMRFYHTGRLVIKEWSMK